MPLIGLNWLMTCWAFSGLLQKSEADCFSRKDSRCFFLPRMSKRVPQEAQTVGKVLHLFFGFRVHRAHPGEVRQIHPVQPAVIPPACSIRKILGLVAGQANRPTKPFRGHWTGVLECQASPPDSSGKRKGDPTGNSRKASNRMGSRPKDKRKPPKWQQTHRDGAL